MSGTVQSPVSYFANLETLQYPTLCKVCDIHLSSYIVAKQHYAGKKHKKKFQNSTCPSQCNGKDSTAVVYDSSAPNPTDNILKSVLKKNKESSGFGDLSVYRTPSGCYYCKSCNLSVNSASQFKEHISSRKHNSLTVVGPKNYQGIAKKERRRFTTIQVQRLRTGV